ncbi:NADH-quinone oxidoreductase subunit J [Methylophaga pinxianii]|uniref:NADH-quinone oxidoreductase subunit J n=1 Tax=Methylophaga pinxianii TaxID=2881052 RepID=UPI001CF57D8B|nr:NADH-quinone oxidoreductase subunit J [Methylophaga pinxianii]MCB2427180.1 NADH-quinone oxidoreductase subunit J [Methylophaga pinxianii]UPH46763.1 NADH-quinone oxidoreductase subunit J [Methylophaga pinxianii]
MEKILFYCFAGILLFAATMVITVRNPVRAALFLVLAFFTSAAIWLMLEAEFLAISLVLVYVGAVLVLFLFVVMMLDIDTSALKEGFTRYLPLGLLVAVLIVLELIAVLGAANFGLDQVPAPVASDESNTKMLGRLLYTVYVYPFEIASVILTVAIVAAITLTLRPHKRKTQDPAQQVKVRSKDRVRLIKMASEKRQDGKGKP